MNIFNKIFVKIRMNSYETMSFVFIRINSYETINANSNEAE